MTSLGSGGFALAVGLILFSRTGSAAVFGVVLGLEFGCGLIGQFVGGSFIDRHDVLRAAVVSNALRGGAVLVAGLGMLVTEGTPLVVGAFLLCAAIRPFHRSANFALVPRICAPKDLARVNSLRAGLLYVAETTGLLWVSLINVFAPLPMMLFWVAGCLLLGTATLMRLRRTRFDFAGTPPAAAGALRSLIYGWKELAIALRHTPSVFLHLALGCSGPVVVALLAVLVAPVSAAIGAGAVGVLILNTSVAVGALIGITIARWVGVDRLTSMVVVSYVVMAPATLLLGAWQYLATAIMAFAMFGCGAVLSVTALNSLLQLRTAVNLIGRLAVSQEFVVSMFGLVAIPIFGRVVGDHGLRAASYICTMMLAGFTTVLGVSWLWRRARLFTTPVLLPGQVVRRVATVHRE
jgi:hypothetical protein